MPFSNARSVLLAQALLAAVLSGCSEQSEDTSPSAEGAGGVPAAGASPADPGPPTGTSRPSPAAADPGAVGTLHFTDEAAARGLTAPNHLGDPVHKRWAVEEIGQGAALFDFDGDGDLDAYLVDGCSVVPPGTEVDAPAHLLPPATAEDWRPAFDGQCRLYENDGTGHFTDVTEGSGVGYRGLGSGVTAADYDNDGDLDLYLTCWGPNRLFRNDGGGKFSDVTESAGVGDPRWSVGSCWLDYDRDGFLDLYVSNYFVMTSANDPELWQKVDCSHHDLKVACGPRGMVPEADVLYRNRGDGSFEDASEASGVLDNPGPFYGLGVVAFDSDRDGDTDLYVANDSRANFLFENQGDGTFTEIADFAGVAMSDNGVPQAGMGIAVGDYDNDLDLDLFLTNFSEDDNTLYRNERRNLFRDITMRMNFGETSYFSLGWGTGFADFDNDGDVDLFVANGHVYPEADQRAPELAYRQPNRLFRNDDGQFVDVTDQAGPGLAKVEASRGAAFGDVDGDGDVDVLVVELNAPPTLLINQLGEGHHRIFVTLEGVTANREGLGARVVVEAGGKKLIQEVRAGHSFASCDDRRLHFGTGAAENVDLLRVVWPDGKAQGFRDIATDRWYHIRQGAEEPEIREWSP